MQTRHYAIAAIVSTAAIAYVYYRKWKSATIAAARMDDLNNSILNYCSLNLQDKPEKIASALESLKRFNTVKAALIYDTQHFQKYPCESNDEHVIVQAMMNAMDNKPHTSKLSAIKDPFLLAGAIFNLSNRSSQNSIERNAEELMFDLLTELANCIIRLQHVPAERGGR